MSDSKVYLNVPYAQKDAAKALGARWDASKKKWYAPAKLDGLGFEQWKLGPTEASSPKNNHIKKRTTTKQLAQGTTTHANDINFVAYNDERSPWD